MSAQPDARRQPQRDAAPSALSPSDVAHLALRLGRLMLASGAAAGRVQAAVADFARDLGCEAQVMVTAEGLILTLQVEDGFRTRLGHSASGVAVNVGALTELRKLRLAVREARGALDPAEIDRRLDAVEHARPRYPRLLVALGMGLTAAALARLFGAPWPVVGVSLAVGVTTQSVRQALARREVNLFLIPAAAAFCGGLVGAFLMRFFPGVPATLCLVAAGMILVPGAPLINGLRDVFGNHVGLGVARLVFGAMTLLAITSGLLAAGLLGGVTIPVEGAAHVLPVREDFAFSALAGVGFALLFNVAPRAAWACVLCAMVGHGLRTAAMHVGADLALGALIGAFAASLLARALASRLDAPPVAFAFPGVVSMIPGAFGFRAALGGLEISRLGTETPPALLAETFALSATTALMMAAIAIGLCLALTPGARLGGARDGGGR